METIGSFPVWVRAKACKWGGRWKHHDLLWCEARQTGWILETAALKPFVRGGVGAELNRLAAAVIAKTRLEASNIGGPLRIERRGRRLSYDFKHWWRSEGTVAAVTDG